MAETLKKAVLYICIFFAPLALNAQYYGEKDSLTLIEHFTKGNWHANSRTFFMATVNHDSLKDDYALASSIGMSFTSKPYYGITVGAEANFIFNLNSSAISQLDPTTNMPNRYELGLFDIQNPTRRFDIATLQKLFIKYRYNQYSVEVGRIEANNPFFNPQDGRMRPTAQEGVWFNIGPLYRIRGLTFSGGWFWTMSPRSTTQWYSMANTLGIYPSGVDVNGVKSNYHGNIKSNGVAMLNVKYRINETFKLSFWDAYFDNVMNTAQIEFTGFKKFPNSIDGYVGLIYIRQDAVNNGGNADQTKTYITKGAQSNSMSAQLGIRWPGWNVNVNYTHITGDGRYLMPREWGRDPFYTFMPRERNEGLGNVHAATIKIIYALVPNKLNATFNYGYFNLPDVKNYRLNKYGQPSYHQLNYELVYTPKKFFKGVEIKLLIAQKINAGNTYNNPRYVYNKVNMVNFNLIVDVKF